MGWAAGLKRGREGGVATASARAASFLHRESRQSPLHVGSLALLEAAPFLDERGRFRLDDARDHVAEHLHRWPALRRRTQPVPFGQGRPVWVSLWALRAARSCSTRSGPAQALPLDRRRPLWELWFVDGVEGDRVAMVQKTHLALAHERGAVGALEVFLDGDPTPPVDVPAWTGHKAPNNAALLARTLAERATRPTEDGALGASRAARAPGALTTGGRRSRRTVEIGSQLRYEVVRAVDASEPELRAGLRSLDQNLAMTFETLAGPRHLLGARLLEAFPSAPRGGAALAIAALSHDGRTGIGLTGHRAASGDLRALVEGLDRAFNDLGAAAG